ncbi:MAG TPA: hypothetical protein VE825_17510 [Terriglobales bacterium]|jgi:hypothetical protein|nr:hypothetical protein [Terriglobales bacterium]
MASSPPPQPPPQPSPATAPARQEATLLGGPASAGPAEGRHVPIWLHRLSLFTFVLFCVVVGMALVVLPWSPQWTENSLLAPYPGLRSFLRLDFVRGLVSGLGLLDLWFGISEAIHYREP